MREAVKTAIRDAITVSSHVRIAAAACAADLMDGPHFARRPEEGWKALTEDDASPIASDLDEEVGQVYSGPVGELLRDFISGLPIVYIDEDDCVHASEPDVREEEGGTIGPFPYSELQATTVEALFGGTISREVR